MKGMILKDFINIKTQLVYYAAAALVFGAVSVVMNNIYFFCGFMLFISLGSLMSAMAYDEQDRWAKFAVASGVPRRKLVGEKYLLSLFLTIPVMLLGLVVVCLLAEQRTEGIYAVLMYGFLALLMAAFIMPLFFRFGAEKARVFFIVCFLAATAIVTASMGIAEKAGGENFFLLGLIVVSACAAAAFTISYFISLRIYIKKEFN